MPTPDFLQPLLRRWYLLILGAVLGAIVGGVAIPAPGPRAERFKATALLLPSQAVVSSASKGTPQLVVQAQALVKQGALPSIVATTTGYPGGVVALLGNLDASIPQGSSLLNLSFTDEDQRRAATVLDAVSAQLIATLTQQNQQDRETRRKALEQTLATYNARLANLADRAKTEASAKADFDQTTKLAQGVTTDLATLATAINEPPLRSSGPAISQPLQEGAQPAAVLRPLPVRLAIGLVAGVAAVVLLLLGLDRLDVRLRTKAAAELGFDLPVLAEVPRLRGRARPSAILLGTDRGSAFAEAHRILRTAVLATSPGSPLVEDLTAFTELGGVHVRPSVILVTSADPAEGKTTTAVNLAASFAEAGFSTILAGFDLRHDDLHERARRLEVVNHTIGGIPGCPAVKVADSATTVSGLRLVTVVGDVTHPAAVMPTLRRHIDRLREQADIVIIDSPPILVCNDTAELLPAVDTVVLTCRAGRTTLGAAERAAEVLARLKAPVCGVVLVGAKLRASVRKGYGRAYSAPSAPPMPPAAAFPPDAPSPDSPPAPPLLANVASAATAGSTEGGTADT